MRLIRSWPHHVPPGRSYVVDDLPRFLMSGHDYSGLVDLDDDVLLVEWDIAVGREDLQHFAEHAAREPDRVLAGAYKLYRDSQYRDLWPEGQSPWIWMLNHWRGEDVGRVGPRGLPLPGSGTYMPEPGDPTCNGFGFGLVYLPLDLIAGYAETGGRFGDLEFSLWHHRNVRPDARVCWHTRAVHLAFDVDDLPGVRDSA